MHTLTPFLSNQPSIDEKSGHAAHSGGKETVFMGFACDEGVRRNNGRPGAAGGPLAFAAQWEHVTHVIDGGLYTMQSQALSLFQQTFSRAVAKTMDSGRTVLAVGGGHEITWAMHLAMLQCAQNESMPLIGHINFDAHFDLRPYFNGPNSGTSFRQIADERRHNDLPFHYLCLGLDTNSTPEFLFRTAREHKVQFHLNTEVQNWQTPDWIQCIETFAASVDRLYVTLDLDVFRADTAPGVSAVAKNGLDPEALMPVFSHISTMPAVACIDIAELNPVYDIEGVTAKLAVESALHFTGHRR